MALNYMMIGQRLKRARREKGFTQEVIAEKLDCSVPYISRIECGRVKVNLTRLSQICRILEIPEGKILNGADVPEAEMDTNQIQRMLENCSPAKQNLIYQVIELIANSKL